MTAIADAIAAVLIVSAFLAIALKALSAEQRAGNEKALHAEVAVRMEVAIANAKTEAARADSEKGRADALDAAIVRAVAAGPVDGSYERLLQARDDAHARAAHRDDPPAVRDDGAAVGSPPAIGPDDLLKPGA